MDFSACPRGRSWRISFPGARRASARVDALYRDAGPQLVADFIIEEEELRNKSKRGD